MTTDHQRIAVVTGAARGIGAGVARRLAEHDGAVADARSAERFAGTESELTRRITAGSRRVSAALPWPVLKDQFLSSRRERRLAVFQFMPHRQELVKEFVR